MVIPLSIMEATGLTRHGDVLLGGVPVPPSRLRAGGWFDLRTPRGTYQVEGTPAASWPDGSVKWLHLCGSVDLDGGRANRASLRVADRPSPVRGLRAVQRRDGIEVKHGPLRVVVRPDACHLLNVRRGRRQLSTGPGLSASMAFLDPRTGRRREFSFQPDRDGLSVAVRTANRLVLRLAGKLRDRRGRPGAELVFFIEILRQSPELRLQPVWIYLGEPNRDLVASLTVTYHRPPCVRDARYGFADEKGAYWDVVQRIRGDDRGGNGPRWPAARQVQAGSGFYRTEKATDPDKASWLKVVEGRRGQGWCHLADRNFGVTAAMRYYWQEYPHSLAVDTDRGTLQFGLVPPGGTLDLRRYSPVLHGPAVYETGRAGALFNARLHGARGIGKAHELLLRFHDPEDDDIARSALFFLHPARPLATPTHTARSRVLGAIAPARRRNPVDRVMAGLADFLVAEREVRGWYGLMDFGDVMISFYSDLDRWASDDGGYAWANTESLPDYGLWIAALRAGRADWLEAAVEMSRHNRDVDCYHRGVLRGLGSRHNVNHWGDADKEWRVSMPLARRLHYYITADPWTAEHIIDTVEVYRRYRRTISVAPGATAAMAGLLARWEMTGDPALARTLRNLADLYTASIRPDGRFASLIRVDFGNGRGRPSGLGPHESEFFMNTFGGQHLLVEMAFLLGHRALADALVRHADYWCRAGARFIGALGWLAHAWNTTGRQRYRTAMQAVLRSLGKSRALNHDGRQITVTDLRLVQSGGGGPTGPPRHLALRDQRRRNKVVCVIGDVFHLAPYALGALAAGSRSGNGVLSRKCHGAAWTSRSSSTYHSTVSRKIAAPFSPEASVGQP